MKVVSPYFEQIIDTENACLNTLVLEHPKAFHGFLKDLQDQLSGQPGRVVISEADKPCLVSKKLEILDRFIPFDLNTKTVISKLNAMLEKEGLSGEQFETTMQIVSSIEDYLNTLCVELPCDSAYSKLNWGNLVKSTGIELKNDYHSLPEQVLDYMALVRLLDSEKLFILVNFRSYVTDMELGLFVKDVLSRHYQVLLVDSTSRRLLNAEKRITIDEDLCEI